MKRMADTLQCIVREFHQQQLGAESFSDYWQRVLAEHEPEVVTVEEVPIWQCGSCGYDHIGAAPPGFCPMCTGVRRQFAVRDERAEAR